MRITLIVLSILLAIFVILLLIPIKLVFVFDKSETGNKTTSFIKYGFIKADLSKKDKQTNEQKAYNPEDIDQKPSSFEDKKNNLEKYIKIFKLIKNDVISVFKYAEKRAVTFENIEVVSDFGFENAMHTGIFAGLYNGFVYNVLGLIHNNMTLRSMKVELNPKFENPVFNLHFVCILRIKTVHTIIIAYNVLKLWKKCKKEGSI